MQVPRILNPVVLVVDGLPDLCKDQQVKAYVESSFGSVENCRQALALCLLSGSNMHMLFAAIPENFLVNLVGAF